jgi:tryptophan synthase alpha chain
MEKVKKIINLPLAVGFGISTPEQVSLVSKHADIVVIGSKIINIYKTSNKNGISEITKFLSKIL